MSKQPSIPILVTHSGKFHADDAMAYAILRLAMSLREEGVDHLLLRTRKPSHIERADVVWDVGFEYDPERMRFDHHQAGRATRPDGVPYSAAGLVWLTLGEAACKAVLGQEEDVAQVAASFDEEVVRVIDMQDNGIASSPDTMGFSSLVDDLNPSWNGDEVSDIQFMQAAELAEGLIRNRLRRLASVVAAASIVEAAIRSADGSRIIELPCGMPWQGAVRRMGAEEVAYATFPLGTGAWFVDTMPPEGNPLGQRVPLPSAWGGLEHAALQDACGVPDAIFCHAGLFCGSAGSREGALAMARRSLELASRNLQSPAKKDEAAKALLAIVDFNIYYTAKGYRPHIENVDACIEAIMGALEEPLPLDPWKAEAAGEALNEAYQERMSGYLVELLNPAECVVAVATAYSTAEPQPSSPKP